MSEAPEESTGTEAEERTLADELASLSLSKDLDSALLDHLNILDKYMFHTECLTQCCRMVFNVFTLLI